MFNKVNPICQCQCHDKIFNVIAKLVKFIKWQNMFGNWKLQNLKINYPKIMNKVSKCLEFHNLPKYVTPTCK